MGKQREIMEEESNENREISPIVDPSLNDKPKKTKKNRDKSKDKSKSKEKKKKDKKKEKKSKSKNAISPQPESEIVTHQESPVEVTNDGKTAPDDPTDKKIEVTQIEPAEQAKIEVTEVSDTTDAAEIVPTAVEVDAETVTGV